MNLVRVLAAFKDTTSNSLAGQTLEALHQIYGYMTFNDNKFGILTSWTHALFLRRAETPNRKCLEYYIVELEVLSSSISMLKAWVGIVLLAHNDWFHASPTSVTHLQIDVLEPLQYARRRNIKPLKKLKNSI